MCTCECVRTRPPALGGGAVCGSGGTSELEGGYRAKHIRSPASRVWAAPAVKGAGRKAHCSSERVVGVRVLTLLLSQFDTVFGFLFLFSFTFFLRRSRRVKSSPSPPQSNGNMKPFVLLSCPSCVHLLLPLPPTPPPCCLSPLCVFEPTFRQLRHSSV